MASTYRPTGLFVPLVTPFDEADRVALDALERLAVEALAGGARGLVALSTTGEPSALDEAERAATVDLCARVCREHGGELLVGAGTNDTRTTIAQHARLADVPGVTASLAVVPYYVRPSEAGIVDHYAAVAARSPVPVVAYNVPYRTGSGLGAGALGALAAIDGVVGVKQAVGAVDVDTLSALAACPPDFAILAGDDAFLLPLLLMGGAGAIAASAQVAPARFAALVEAGLAGRVGEARPSAEALLPLVVALFAQPSPAVIKAVLHAQGRIPTPHVRLPLVDASPAAARAAIDLAATLVPSAANR